MITSQITANNSPEDSLPTHYPPSPSSSSPLSRPTWSSLVGNHWTPRQWSNAPVFPRQKKSSHSERWLDRQKRKTFPPVSGAHDQTAKQLNHTHSFPGTLYQQPSDTSSDSPPTNRSHHSSLSKKIKKKKKKRPHLTIETNFTDSISELPPTISSDSTLSTHTSARLPSPPSRFSAHFIDLDGHLGRVEYCYQSQPQSSWLRDLFRYNLYPYNTPFLPIQRLTQEEFKRYSRRLWMDAALFLFGFLLFPLWWIGFGLFMYRKFKRPDGGLQFAVYHELYSIDTVGFLNGAFSLFSLILVVVTTVLIVWLFKEE
ncbi:hypothetical protein A0J61_00490 [Choanephora cucurbitarum]|uniref:Uncharacterized protein n=1 Tax=Choanephora cucurbitarum TaxID=101091 RepID=A0A1C7NQX2_9FUNG|nr:hypothetical protein A0J61_00490 [Choanephora cucurbitarum]